MTGTMNPRLQCVVGVGLCVLMGLGLSIHREEEMVMEYTILIIITALGLVIPLFWIIGTVTGITHFSLHRRDVTIIPNPQLGLTMADGGNPVDKEEKIRPD